MLLAQELSFLALTLIFYLQCSLGQRIIPCQTIQIQPNLQGMPCYNQGFDNSQPIDNVFNSLINYKLSLAGWYRLSPESTTRQYTLFEITGENNAVIVFAVQHDMDSLLALQKNSRNISNILYDSIDVIGSNPIQYNSAVRDGWIYVFSSINLVNQSMFISFYSSKLAALGQATQQFSADYPGPIQGFLSWPKLSGGASMMINFGFSSKISYPGCGMSWRVRLFPNFGWEPGVSIALVDLMKEFPRVLAHYGMVQQGLSTFVVDQSGNHNHANLITHSDAISLPSWTDYQSQTSSLHGGLQFEQGQYLRVPSLNVTSASFLISFWFQHKTGSDCVLIKVLTTQNNQELLRVYLQTVGISTDITVKVRFRASTVYSLQMPTLGSIVIGSWQMLALSCVDILAANVFNCTFALSVTGFNYTNITAGGTPNSTVQTFIEYYAFTGTWRENQIYFQFGDPEKLTQICQFIMKEAIISDGGLISGKQNYYTDCVTECEVYYPGSGDNEPTSSISKNFASYGAMGRCLSCGDSFFEEAGRCVKHYDCYRYDIHIHKCRMQAQGCQDEVRSAPDCYCEKGFFDQEGYCLPCQNSCYECVEADSCASCQETRTKDGSKCVCGGNQEEFLKLQDQMDLQPQNNITLYDNDFWYYDDWQLQKCMPRSQEDFPIYLRVLNVNGIGQCNNLPFSGNSFDITNAGLGIDKYITGKVKGSEKLSISCWFRYQNQNQNAKKRAIFYLTKNGNNYQQDGLMLSAFDEASKIFEVISSISPPNKSYLTDQLEQTTNSYKLSEATVAGNPNGQWFWIMQSLDVMEVRHSFALWRSSRLEWNYQAGPGVYNSLSYNTMKLYVGRNSPNTYFEFCGDIVEVSVYLGITAEQIVRDGRGIFKGFSNLMRQNDNPLFSINITQSDVNNGGSGTNSQILINSARSENATLLGGFAILGTLNAVEQDLDPVLDFDRGIMFDVESQKTGRLITLPKFILAAVQHITIHYWMFMVDDTKSNFHSFYRETSASVNPVHVMSIQHLYKHGRNVFWTQVCVSQQCIIDATVPSKPKQWHHYAVTIARVDTYSTQIQVFVDGQAGSLHQLVMINQLTEFFMTNTQTYFNDDIITIGSRFNQNYLGKIYLKGFSIEQGGSLRAYSDGGFSRLVAQPICLLKMLRFQNSLTLTPSTNVTFGYCILCEKGYYLRDGQCLPCLRNCTACLDQEYLCTMCQLESVSFRVDLSKKSMSCPCVARYFDAQQYRICRPCHFSCLSCTNEYKENCTSCDTPMQTSYRIDFALLNNTCPCQYTDSDLLTRVCLPCSHTCWRCNAANDAMHCTACNLSWYRQDFSTINNTCPCMIGYFESSDKQNVCLKCHISCLTCTNYADYCTSCRNYSNVNSTLEIQELRTDTSATLHTCPCLQGFYQDVQNQTYKCLNCSYLCLECYDSSTKCSLCPPMELTFRSDMALVAQQCPCQDGYYDAGQTICLKCSDLCQTCSGTKSYCTSCYDSQLRTLNQLKGICYCSTGAFIYLDQCVADCEYGIYNSTHCNIPPCAQNVGLVMFENQCVRCHPTCRQCTGLGSEKCTMCWNATNTTVSTIDNSTVYDKIEGYLLMGYCFPECPMGTLINHDTHTCDDCTYDYDINPDSCKPLHERVFVQLAAAKESQENKSQIQIYIHFNQEVEIFNNPQYKLEDMLNFSISVWNYGQEYDFYVKNLSFVQTNHRARARELSSTTQKTLVGTLVLFQNVFLPDQYLCVSFMHSAAFRGKSTGAPLNAAGNHCIMMSAFVGKQEQQDSAFWSQYYLLAALITSGCLLFLSLFFPNTFLKIFPSLQRLYLLALLNVYYPIHFENYAIILSAFFQNMLPNFGIIGGQYGNILQHQFSEEFGDSSARSRIPVFYNYFGQLIYQNITSENDFSERLPNRGLWQYSFLINGMGYIQLFFLLIALYYIFQELKRKAASAKNHQAFSTYNSYVKELYVLISFKFFQVALIPLTYTACLQLQHFDEEKQFYNDDVNFWGALMSVFTLFFILIYFISLILKALKAWNQYTKIQSIHSELINTHGNSKRVNLDDYKRFSGEEYEIFGEDMADSQYHSQDSNDLINSNDPNNLYNTSNKSEKGGVSNANISVGESSSAINNKQQQMEDEIDQDSYNKKQFLKELNQNEELKEKQKNLVMNKRKWEQAYHVSMIYFWYGLLDFTYAFCVAVFASVPLLLLLLIITYFVYKLFLQIQEYVRNYGWEANPLAGAFWQMIFDCLNSLAGLSLSLACQVIAAQSVQMWSPQDPSEIITEEQRLNLLDNQIDIAKWGVYSILFALVLNLLFALSYILFRLYKVFWLDSRNRIASKNQIGLGGSYAMIETEMAQQISFMQNYNQQIEEEAKRKKQREEEETDKNKQQQQEKKGNQDDTQVDKVGILLNQLHKLYMENGNNEDIQDQASLDCLRQQIAVQDMILFELDQKIQEFDKERQIQLQQLIEQMVKEEINAAFEEASKDQQLQQQKEGGNEVGKAGSGDKLVGKVMEEGSQQQQQQQQQLQASEIQKQVNKEEIEKQLEEEKNDLNELKIKNEEIKQLFIQLQSEFNANTNEINQQLKAAEDKIATKKKQFQKAKDKEKDE